MTAAMTPAYARYTRSCLVKPGTSIWIAKPAISTNTKDPYGLETTTLLGSWVELVLLGRQNSFATGDRRLCLPESVEPMTCAANTSRSGRTCPCRGGMRSHGLRRLDGGLVLGPKIVSQKTRCPPGISGLLILLAHADQHQCRTVTTKFPQKLVVEVIDTIFAC